MNCRQQNKISLHINLASPPFILSDQSSNGVYNDANANTTNQDLNIVETTSPLPQKQIHKKDASKFDLIRSKEVDSERIYRIYLNPVCSHFNNRDFPLKSKIKQNYSRNNSNISRLINSEITNADIIDENSQYNKKRTKINRSIKELLKIKSKSNLRSQRLDHILNGTSMAIQNLGSRFKMSGRHLQINFIRSALNSKRELQEADPEHRDIHISKEISNVKLSFL